MTVPGSGHVQYISPGLSGAEGNTPEQTARKNQQSPCFRGEKFSPRIYLPGITILRGQEAPSGSHPGLRHFIDETPHTPAPER